MGLLSSSKKSTTNNYDQSDNSSVGGNKYGGDGGIVSVNNSVNYVDAGAFDVVSGAITESLDFAGAVNTNSLGLASAVADDAINLSMQSMGYFGDLNRSYASDLKELNKTAIERQGLAVDSSMELLSEATKDEKAAATDLIKWAIGGVVMLGGLMFLGTKKNA